MNNQSRIFTRSNENCKFALLFVIENDLCSNLIKSKDEHEVNQRP